MMSQLFRLHERNECDKPPHDGAFTVPQAMSRAGTSLSIVTPTPGSGPSTSLVREPPNPNGPLPLPVLYVRLSCGLNPFAAGR